MEGRRQAELEVAEALACPLDMAQLFKVEGRASFEPLEHLWAEIVGRHAVDQEAYLDALSSLIEEIPDESLRQMQKNVRTWRDRARQEFLSQTRRFWNLRYAPREEYDKHLPPRGRRQTTSWIEDRSRHGPSLFYQDVPPDVMLSAFLHGIFLHFSVDEISGQVTDGDLWSKLLHDRQARFAFRSRNEIGATRGVATRFLAFDLDASIPILHAYPIDEQEADAIRGASGLVTTDDLFGWGR